MRGTRHIVSTAVVLLASCAFAGCGPIIAGVLLSMKSSSGPGPDTTPRIASVSPASASHGGGVPVTISGANFAPDAIVTFGAFSAATVGGVDTQSASITVMLPRSSTLGPVDVVVTNPSGGTGTLAQGFTYTNGLPTALVAPLSSPQSQNVVFSVTLADPESDPADIAVSVATDGINFSPIPASFILSGGLTGLSTSPAGVPHTLTWDSRRTFGVANVANVQLRVTPKDPADGGKPGTSGTSSPFLIGNNTPVQVQIVQPANDAFDVALDYKVSDPDAGETVRVTALAWNDLSSGASGALTVKSGQGVGPVAYSAAGTNATTVWDSLADLGWGNDRLVTVTVTVDDGSSTASATTAPFFVSNGPLADQKPHSLTQRPDGIAIGDVNSSGRLSVVACRGGSDFDQQGRIAVSINRGQTFDAATVKDAPLIQDPAFTSNSPNPGNPFLSPVPHPTECVILDANGDSQGDLVAAEAFNAANTSIAPLVANLATVLVQCAADSPSFGHVILHQQTFTALQKSSALDIAKGTYETAQVPIARMAPLTRAPSQTPSDFAGKTTANGDPSHDNVGWFIQHMVAAELDAPGTPRYGTKDLVILDGIDRLSDALTLLTVSPVPSAARGCVVLRQVDGTGSLAPASASNFYLDPTDMGILPVHCAVADILSTTRAGALYTSLNGGTPPVLGLGDIVVVNQGDDSLTFYFQIAAATTPGTDAPTFASYHLPLRNFFPSLPDGDLVGVATGDLNGDGANDFVVVGQLSKLVFIFVYDPDPTSPGSLVSATGGLLPFRIETPLPLPAIQGGRPAIADVSGDGLADIIVPMQLTNEIAVFVNTTSGPASPLSFFPGNGASPATPVPIRFAAGFGPYEVLAADMNGDLRTDIVSANGLGQDFSVFYQTSPGTLDGNFIPIPSGTSPLIVRAGDVSSATGGGPPNVVVSMGGENKLYVYQRDPTSLLSVLAKYDLSSVPGGPSLAPQSPFDVTLANVISAPGKLDILVAMEVVALPGGGATGGVELIPGCPLPPLPGIAAIFTGTGGPIGFSAAAGVLDASGIPSIVLTGNQADTVTIFSPAGPKGSLLYSRQEITGMPATEVVIVDLDGDKPAYPDIVIGTGLPEINILYNGGNPRDPTKLGTFPDPPVNIKLGALGNSVAIVCSDLRGLGRRDIIVSGFTSGTAGILFQSQAPDPPRTFTLVPLVSGGQPSEIAIGDLNGDGRADIAITWGSDDVLAVYYQNPKPTGLADAFLGPVTYKTGSTPIGCAILDVLGNGKNDVVVSCRGANALNVFLQR